MSVTAYLERYFEKKVRAKPASKRAEAAIEKSIEVSGRILELTQKLRETEEKTERTCAMLRAVIDAMPGLVWGKRLDGTFFLTNSQVREKMLGGISIEEARAGSAESFAKSMARGDTLHIDCARTDSIVLKKQKGLNFIEKGFVNGQFTVLRTSKAPFYDKNGKLIGTVGFGREITKDCSIINDSLSRAKDALITCPRVCEPSLGLISLLEGMVTSVEGEYSEACEAIGQPDA